MPPETTGDGHAGRRVTQVRDGVADAVDDQLAEEAPVAVHYDGEPFAVMMATPRDLVDFAHGFSLTEGRAGPGDIVGVDISAVLEGVLLDIRTRDPANAAATAERMLPGRSGCGICGTRLLEEIARRPPRVGTGPVLSSAALQRASLALQALQPLNAVTGATHAAAWASTEGMLLLVREDVGRHNALDKMIGAMLVHALDPQQGFALVTSRASYEMVTKAALAGITVLAAISAPTALAVDLARDCGLTLAGFVRPGRHVLYSHPHRLRPGN